MSVEWESEFHHTFGKTNYERRGNDDKEEQKITS